MGSGTFNAERRLREQVELRTAVADLLRDQANVVRLGRDSDTANSTTRPSCAMPGRHGRGRTRPGRGGGSILRAADGRTRARPSAGADVGDVISVTVR